MTNTVHHGDCLTVLKTFPDEFIDCCVTSPPYWGLRDYGVSGQLGLEKTPEEYVAKMVEVFREVKRVLKKEGTVWLNLGDSYNGSGKAGSNPEYQDRHTEFGKPSVHKERFGMPTDVKDLKPKDLVGIPWRVAFALQADGWYLRSDIIWHKPNPMPESVTDRPTKSHEYIFLLSKSAKYYFDQEAVKEEATGYDGRRDTLYKGGTKDMACTGQHQRWKRRKNDDTNYGGNGNGFKDHSGYNKLENPYVRNIRSVWTIPTSPYPEAHFATFPPKLIEPCILAGCPENGIVLDPFIGSGTVAQVATLHRRNWIGIELNPDYIKLADKRRQVTPRLL
jgi:DNA modification methylase